ncbi:hypothetical protein D3C74_286880 [compost metagenome]
MLVANDLNFHVFHAGQILLKIHAGVTESFLRFLLGRRNLLDQRFLVFGDTDPFAPAAGRRFDDNRISDVARHHDGFIQILNQTVRAGNDGHVRFFHRLLRHRFIPHAGDRFRRRPNECNVAGTADFCEVGIFSQEPIAGMNRITLGQSRYAHQVRQVQITVLGQRGSNAISLVGQAHMQRILVRFGINRHGGNPQLAASPNDPHGDLAAVSNQYFMEFHVILVSSFGKLLLLLRLHQKERLPVFDHLSILHKDVDDLTFDFRLQFIHQLHRFDNADRRLLADLVADVHVWLGFRRRGTIKCSDHRRSYGM